MSTKVVLIRHAIPEGGMFPDDALRPISQEGRRLQRRMNRWLKALGIAPDRLFHSPYQRTKDTAHVIAEDFSVTAHTAPALAPEGNEAEVLLLLPHPSLNQTIFLVGHGPALRQLAYYCSGIASPVEIERSGAYVLLFEEEVAAGSALPVQYYSPRSAT